MYLKALEIQGFKSFPDKVYLPFEENITAIVGPNGSGKSNISDAILWVMGEQRTKNLRGGKMEDVIFGGTEKRPKTGFAQVSLIIDNSGRILDTDSSEIMISRRYYRSGESEYYINRESVRLKDITELLMDTGLGRYGYSIIGQGKISDIVSAKSGDRRELFEEAAGISRYRWRKDESERKLERTEENLTRISDKIDELKLQVDPLKEQSEKAKKYLLLRDELRLLEISVWMNNLEKLNERSATIAADLEKAQSERVNIQLELDKRYAETDKYSEKMREEDIKAENTRARLSEVESERTELDSEIKVLENTLRLSSEREAQLLSEIEEQSTRAKALENQIAFRNSRIEEINTELNELNAFFAEMNAKVYENTEGGNDFKRKTAELLTQKSEKQLELEHFNTMLNVLADEKLRREGESKKRAEEAGKAESRRKELKLRLSGEKESLANAEGRVTGLANVIAGHKLRIDRHSEQVRVLENNKTELTIKLGAARSRAKMLSEMEKEYEGFSRAVKTVMQESERGVLKGVYGPVGNLLRADEKFSLAIETALGGSMQSIIIDTQEQGKTAIELLKRRDSGRATFLPLGTIKGSELKSRPEGEKGYLGTAFELADFDKKFVPIFSSLLGRTAVAETLTDAVAMSKRHNHMLRIVTLDGQLINAGGSMSGGSAAKNTGFLSRANELKAVEHKLSELQAEVGDSAAKLNVAGRELASARYELETAEIEFKEANELFRTVEADISEIEFLLRETENTIAGIDESERAERLRQEENKIRSESIGRNAELRKNEIAAIEAELQDLGKSFEEQERVARELTDRLSSFTEKRSSLIAESETSKSTIEELEKLLLDILSDGDTRQKSLSDLAAEKLKLSELSAESRGSLEKASSSAEQIRSKLKSINDFKLDLEGKRTRSEKEAQEKNRELLDAERLCSGIGQAKISAEMEEKQIIDKLWDNYELSRTAAKQLRQPIESMSGAQKRISGLKKEIASLGTPNLGAVAEYERVSQRYNFLTEQRDDVIKSKKELEGIIAGITQEMEIIFRDEFKVIDESFRETFLELFGGGKAALELEDEDDILNCGIEIKVQPPGKALTKLSLLSGGETAFVAIALYFAIIKVRPTPFCVMDEIEAALDEVNVGRFAAYMRELSDKTQFIVITHRRSTMEEADILYGVTMQEKGVSQVITLDLNKAEMAINNKGK